MSLGEQLKNQRHKKQLSQPELAELAGIEQSYLSKLENDKATPSNEILRKLLSALELTLEQLLERLPPESVNALSQLPDVEQMITSKQQNTFNQRRRLLLGSSFLVALAITLFFTGYSKLVFTEVKHEYYSEGVVLDGEPKGIFKDWPRLYGHDKESRKLKDAKSIEMTKRQDLEHMRVDTWLGEYIEKPVQGGTRYFKHFKEVEEPQPINAWLQVIAVFMFVCGVMGFVLERRVFK